MIIVVIVIVVIVAVVEIKQQAGRWQHAFGNIPPTPIGAEVPPQPYGIV